MKLKPLMFLWLTLFTLFTPTPPAHAIPKLLTYQGILKDSAGNYLTGTYSMTFRIYGAAAGGTALWTETQPGVSTSSGKFTVQLGTVTALNLPFTSDYWLSLQVGTDAEMTPRVRLTSAGYAYMAEQVANGFSQAQHDGLSHKNIESVKDNTVNIAKTNFKLDAYTMAAADSMGELIIDSFNDAAGIHAASSSGYTWRGSPNYDVTVTPAGGGVDSYAVLMLHTNGTNGSSTFTDSGSGAKTVTAGGNAQISTAQSKFGGASGAFDGSGDYLAIADHADWDFGTGDFTIDLWVRFNQTNIIHGLIGAGGGYSNWVNLYKDDGGSLLLYIMGNFMGYFPWSPSAGTWYHVAVTRSGPLVRVFVNGTQTGSTLTNSSNITLPSGSVELGRFRSPNIYDLNGYIDEARISKGIARWTANFTPSASEYAAPSSGGNAAVVSTAYAETIAPTEAMVIPSETLNTGSITYYVSRNNGTTWTECAKETVVNISSQPAGTQLRWKAVITGNAELDAVAVAV